MDTQTGSQEKRPLGIPVVRDRVVQAALRNVIEPIFERDFAAQSYGFRPGRGTREALRRVEELLKKGNCWVVDADIKGYFDSIPHNKLMEKIGKKISDGRVMSWRAGCVNSACPVRREGELTLSLPLPWAAATSLGALLLAKIQNEDDSGLRLRRVTAKDGEALPNDGRPKVNRRINLRKYLWNNRCTPA